MKALNLDTPVLFFRNFSSDMPSLRKRIGCAVRPLRRQMQPVEARDKQKVYHMEGRPTQDEYEALEEIDECICESKLILYRMLNRNVNTWWRATKRDILMVFVVQGQG